MNRLAVLFLILSGFSAAAERPNLLFILADDMGWQDTSVAFAKERTKFNDRFHTPAMERMAREGAKFTQAYSCAVCSPTRVSFLTGQNAARHGVTQWTQITGDKPTPDLPHPTLSHAAWNWNGLQPAGTGLPHSVEATTLPALLKKAGYRTMHFGKGHFGAAGTPGADPKVFGFDVRIGGRDAGGCGSNSGLKNFGAKANPNGPWRAWDLDHYFGQDIHLTEALTLEAKREIRSAVADGQPFFCYFAHYAPHTPIELNPLTSHSAIFGRNLVIYLPLLVVVFLNLAALVITCRRLAAILRTAMLFAGVGQAAGSITPDLKAAANSVGWKPSPRFPLLPGDGARPSASIFRHGIASPFSTR